jgi:hypothetical protein
LLGDINGGGGDLRAAVAAADLRAGGEGRGIDLILKAALFKLSKSEF